MPTVENKRCSSCRWLFQVSDLLNQVVLLISELFVIRPFFLEIAQKLNQLGLVFQQDLHNRLCFVWTGHKNLEHMECFKLNVGAFISQQVHHQLQVFWFADVFCHDGKVVSVQNQFTQKL